MPNKRLRPPDIASPFGADDFRQISGIGPAVATRLYNAGILTYAQLAAQSPESIAALVADLNGLSAERIAKHGWIEQAQELTPHPRADDSPAERQHYATFKVDLLLNEGDDVRRTHAVFIQGNQQAIWAGWDGTRLLDFFAEHANLHTHPGAAPPAHADTAPPSPAAESPASATADSPAPAPPPIEEQPTQLQLDIGALSVAPVVAQTADGSSSVSRLRAQLDFQLSGAAAGPFTASGSPYTVLILACALPSGKTAVLATDQQHLRPDLLNYATTVEFPIPASGRYQIQGLVVLPQARKARTALGRVLRIDPM